MEGEKRQVRYSEQGAENPAKWDPETRVLEIRGVRYSIELFEAWAEDGLSDGAIFRIVERVGGVVTLEEIKHPDPEQGKT